MEFKDLKPGPDYAAGLAASLARAATLPGVIDRVTTCDTCGAEGRATWSPIVPVGACHTPPTPLGWGCKTAGSGGGVTCADCMGQMLGQAMAAMRAWLATPAGRAQLLAESCEAQVDA